MPGKDGPENLRILKRHQFRLDYWGTELGLGSLLTEILDITKCASRWGGVSIVRNVSLLVLLWTEVKKLIDCSYLKQQSSPVLVYVLYYFCE